MPITRANEDKIDGAIASLNLIRITYSKKKTPQRTITERVVRIVEPYEVKDGYLYAWDTTRDKTTKTFILDNINNVLVLSSKFKNRYPDAGKAFPTYESAPPPDARRQRPTVNTTAFV
jgi:predicted DNA-binding transcriptional regulator YafY